jgi:hypothetical protein
MGDIDYRNGEWLTFIPACAIPAISGFGTRRGSERRSDLSLRISAAHFFTAAGAPLAALAALGVTILLLDLVVWLWRHVHLS